MYIFFQVRHQASDRFVVIEESAGHYPDDRINRDGGQHAQNPPDVPRNEQDDENLQRGGLDTGRINNRLEDKVIDKLHRQHDGKYNHGKHQDIDVQADAGSIFEHQTEHHAQDLPDEGSHNGRMLRMPAINAIPKA